MSMTMSKEALQQIRNNFHGAVAIKVFDGSNCLTNEMTFKNVNSFIDCFVQCQYEYDGSDDNQIYLKSNHVIQIESFQFDRDFSLE